jgi:hypothetical protein
MLIKHIIVKNVCGRSQGIILIKFKLDVYSVLRSLSHVNLGSAVDVSDIHAASIFRVEESRVVECVYIGHWSNRTTGKCATWCPFGANRGSGREKLSNCPSTLKAEAVCTS